MRPLWDGYQRASPVAPGRCRRDQPELQATYGGYASVSRESLGAGSSEQSYAQINSDGSIGSFNGATGSHTISGAIGGYNFFNHSATYFADASGNPHVLILGGEDVNTGTPHAGVWYQH